MPDNPRIEDLKRRVQKDPASIAFAQLAEEYRRAGEFEHAVEVCQAGLRMHPGYLSAHVTLGRALVELGRLDEAQHELELVLKGAPENLAALRGLAEIHHRRGAAREALTYYRAALALARNDPDLEQTVADLARQVEPAAPAAPHDGLSFAQMERELAGAVPPSTSERATDVPDPTPAPVGPAAAAAPALPPPVALPEGPSPADLERTRSLHMIDALEEWLAGVHAARADRQP